MKLKLTLTNFKCWSNKTIEFVNGVTLIMGTSGVGKTTLLDAIAFVLYKKGNKLVKKGEKRCSVKLNINDTLIITRSKGPDRLIWYEQKTQYEDEVAQHHIYNRFGDATSKLFYLKQDAYDSFIYLSPSKKLEFLESILFKNLDISKKKKKVTDLHHHRQLTIKTIQAKIKVVQELLEELKCIPAPFPFVEHLHYSMNKRYEYIQGFYALIKRYELKLHLLHKRYQYLIQQINTLFLNKSLKKQILTSKGETENNIKQLGFDASIEPTLQSTYNQLNKTYNQYLQCKKNIQRKNDLTYKLTQESKQYKQYKQEAIKLKEKLSTFSDVDVYETKIKETETLLQNKKNIDKKIKKIGKIKETLLKYQSISNFLIDVLTNKIQVIQQALKCETEFLTCPACTQALKYKNSTLRKVDESKIISKKEQASFHREIKQLNMDRNELKGQLQQKQNLEHELFLYEKEVKQFKTTYDIKMGTLVLQTSLQTAKSKLTLLNQLKRDYRYALRTYKGHKKEMEHITLQLEPIKKQLVNINTFEEESILLKKLHDAKFEHDNFCLNKKKYEKWTNEKKYLETKLNAISFNQLDFNKMRMNAVLCKMMIDCMESNYTKYTQKKIKCEKWLQYYNHYKQLEKHRVKLKLLEIEEKVALLKLKGSIELQQKIKKIESYVLTNSIHKINLYLDTYNKCLFPTKNITISLSMFKLKKKTIKSHVNILINQEQDIYPLLSGGEKQRVNIALTLAMAENFNIPFLFLDECTSNLDQELATRVVSLLKEKQFKKPIVMIAHQIVEGMFDHVQKIAS